MPPNYAAELNQRGFAIVPDVISEEAVKELRLALQPSTDSQHLRRSGVAFAARNLLRTHHCVTALAINPRVWALAYTVLGSGTRAVKATYFDKTPGANWKVPPHQDLTIAVTRKIDIQGFGPWSTKGGFCNVQPPPKILDGMLAIRIHLDNCDSSNGAVRVWPGSHKHGRLKDCGISEWLEHHSSIVCEVPAGGVLLMRPLLVHASSPAEKPVHRRVIHIEYAGFPLPNELCWLDEVTPG